MRAVLEGGGYTPALFRDALGAVPPVARDTWVDRALGLEAIAEDGADLPRGCVPYLPCSVDALLRLIEHAPVGAGDVFVDVGAGLGRAVALVHLLTGAPAIGVEVQPAHVAASRALAMRLRLRSASFLSGDAAEIVPQLTAGSVFFLYCPFSGDRLVKLLADSTHRPHPPDSCLLRRSPAAPLPLAPGLRRRRLMISRFIAASASPTRRRGNIGPMRRLLIVADTFAVTDRGVIVAPMPPEHELRGPADVEVELRLPDGTRRTARLSIALEHFYPPPGTRLDVHVQDARQVGGSDRHRDLVSGRRLQAAPDDCAMTDLIVDLDGSTLVLDSSIAGCSGKRVRLARR